MSPRDLTLAFFKTNMAIYITFQLNLKFYLFILFFYSQAYQFGSVKVKQDLRVTSSNLRVASSNPRVRSSNPRVRSSNLRVMRLKARVARLKARVQVIKPRNK